MRRLFTTASSGLTDDALRWGQRIGRWRRVQRSVYAEGPEPVTQLDRERARVLAAAGVARGALAGAMHRLDVELDGRPLRRLALPPDRLVVIDELVCADALQTLVDLARALDDDRWEQALESALRRRLVTIDEIEAVATPRIRRVLRRRPAGAPPTESLLETLAVQLVRTLPELGEPVRQHVVRRDDGSFVARLDLSWPARGMFLELDGQQHAGQPVYDARRETAVVAVTGWLPARATWHEVTRVPRATGRRWVEVARQCQARELAPIA